MYIQRALCALLSWLAIAGSAAAQTEMPMSAHGTSEQPALNPGLQALASEFFAWRARTQPAWGDDIPRVERPAGWVPDVSPAALAAQRERYREFRRALDGLSRAGWSRADKVDALLLRSAIERVRWELEVRAEPYRNPDFYVQQTLGSIFELLVLKPPVTRERTGELIIRLRAFPQILEHARENLVTPVQPFADVALANMDTVSERLDRMQRALAPEVPAELREELDSASAAAADALEAYARWLQAERGDMREDFALGHDAYAEFLRLVALVPASPEELLRRGRQAWQRAVAFEALERTRNLGLPEQPIFASAAAQIARQRQDERAIRRFLEQRQVMTVPEWLRHYVNQPMPGYLAPIAHMGVTDDLTSERRLDEDGVRYIRPPDPDLPYFELASARDTRPIIVHEGVPGHYFQLALSWRNPDPIRRRYIDSGANEGIGFYVEELLLQLGLFDDAPRTREIIYSFMRLRALRVEVDIQLALGDFDMAQAADYLAEAVPMDRETAVQEAGWFAAGPGQAISYQIGKLQILEFLSDARLALGERFSLRGFHDYLMLNGNVPIALQRWEYLERDEGELAAFE